MWTTARRIGTALAGAALLAGNLFSTPAAAVEGQSTFVSENKKISFGLTVPDKKYDDIFFTIRAPTGTSWAAIGLGSPGMAESLILMIYLNEAGDNVTFSPRTSHGHWEPKYYPDAEYTILNGTGIDGDDMVFSAHCTSGCRSWTGGYLDVSGDHEDAIYALGPQEAFNSDDPAAPIKFHEEFGSFKVNVRRTFGSPDSPSITDDSKNSGVEVGGSKKGLSDVKSTVHAVFMVLVFIVFLPSGVLVLRFADSPKWHGVVQGVSLLGGLVGFAMGIVTSFHYNRSRGFTSAHQIIGILVTAGLLGQFVVGLLHHLQFRRTQRPTKLAPYHVWTGRVVIPLGIANAFVGFIFALNSWRNLIIAILVLVVAAVSAALALNRLRQNRRARNNRTSSPTFGFSSGPKGPNEPYADDGAGVGLREYAPSPAQIGLMDVSGGSNLGPEQKGREFL